MAIEKPRTSTLIIPMTRSVTDPDSISSKYSQEVRTALESNDYKSAAFVLAKWAEYEEKHGNIFSRALRERSYDAYVKAGDIAKINHEPFSAVQSYMNAMRQIHTGGSFKKISEAAKKASEICISEVQRCIREGTSKGEIEWYSRGKSVAELLNEIEGILASGEIVSLRRTFLIFALFSSVYVLSSMFQIPYSPDLSALRMIAKI
jgi:uncharacterized protein YerC